MRHLIDSTDLTPQEWYDLYARFEDILTHAGDYRDALQGRTMASLFYEPSTRTRFSFEAAMHRLGGGVFGFSDPNTTSAAKGETLRDTAIMVSGYADAVVCRHPREGAALALSLYASCPVINAGDGGHCHPTQTLTDIATLTHLRGRLDGMKIGVCGDLKHGRTVHSLLRALCRFYRNVQVYLISPPDLRLPSHLKKEMEKAGLRLYEVTNLEATIGILDVLYMTRIQKERFIDPLEYERLKGVYVLTASKLRAAKPDMLVLHPLPRVDEIHPDVDDDPRAVYFEQAKYGMFIRMALLLTASETPVATPSRRYETGARVCQNPVCITAGECYLPPLTNAGGLCLYCEHEG